MRTLMMRRLRISLCEWGTQYNEMAMKLMQVGRSHKKELFKIVTYFCISMRLIWSRHSESDMATHWPSQVLGLR